MLISQISNSKDCNYKESLKVGIIPNNYVDYQHYLYYTLGNYSLRNNIEFEINNVDFDLDEYDILFGEYKDLIKLSKFKVDIPEKIEIFYEKNNISIVDNIFPLDLDTLILLTKSNIDINSLEDLVAYNHPIRYTTALPILSDDTFLKLLSFSLKNDFIEFNHNNTEYLVSLFKELHSNFNKNIINSTYLELYNSFEDRENIYTLFSDGILLNKNINYENFILFPNPKYIWNENKGIFDNNNNSLPISFYGFSAYVNNSNQIGFLCYLVEEEIRLNTFRNFNNGISPLSSKELEKIKDQLSTKHIEILDKKNQQILNPFIRNDQKNIDELIDIILNINISKKEYNGSDYLN